MVEAKDRPSKFLEMVKSNKAPMLGKISIVYVFHIGVLTCFKWFEWNEDLVGIRNCGFEFLILSKEIIYMKESGKL